VELHISEVDNREEWRRHSVIADLCVGRVQGRGMEGYRDAMEILQKELTR
jgi:3-dehydroquinate dehydratase-2